MGWIHLKWCNDVPFEMWHMLLIYLVAIAIIHLSTELYWTPLKSSSGHKLVVNPLQYNQADKVARFTENKITIPGRGIENTACWAAYQGHGYSNRESCEVNHLSKPLILTYGTQFDDRVPTCDKQHLVLYTSHRPDARIVYTKCCLAEKITRTSSAKKAI